MRQLYSFFLYLLTPYFWLRLYRKARKLPAYKERISERFSLRYPKVSPVDIWLHAVSLGEVIASIPLVEAMLLQGYSILITTMTPTGEERVRLHFHRRVLHSYIPYDLPLVVKRFFRHFKPQIGLIMETELWPNLFAFAHKAHIPLYLLNARLSARSLVGYQYIAWLIKPTLSKLKGIWAQSEEDAKHFIALGIDNKKVQVLGNIKFDLALPRVGAEIALSLKMHWGESRLVLIAASTHRGEEEALLSRLKKLQLSLPGILLLIAPRHPERFSEVKELALHYGYSTGVRTDKASISSDTEVVVLDSIGELLSFYKVSDIAFVGGSLVPVGGHNVLEPIAMKIPVLTGKSLHNFQYITKSLLEVQAIIIVEDADALCEQIIALSKDERRKQSLIDCASAVLEANKGALERYKEGVIAAITSSKQGQPLSLPR